MKYISLCFLIILSLGCKNNSIDSSRSIPILNESYGSYLVEHTQTEISVADNLLFRFSGAVIEAQEIGKEVDNKIFEIIPNVEGKAYWKDMSTIVFDPDQNLDYNRRYDFKIKLSTIYDDVAETLSDAVIPFQTYELNLDLKIFAINYPPNDGNLIELNGRINSNDVIDDKEIEKMVSASQKGSNVEILWSHTKGNYHSFKISNITRKREETEVIVNFDGSRWDPNFKGKRKQVIFPLGAI